MQCAVFITEPPVVWSTMLLCCGEDTRSFFPPTLVNSICHSLKKKGKKSFHRKTGYCVSESAWGEGRVTPARKDVHCFPSSLWSSFHQLQFKVTPNRCVLGEAKDLKLNRQIIARQNSRESGWTPTASWPPVFCGGAVWQCTPGMCPALFAPPDLEPEI